jgi:ornithine decarboxylase
MVDLDDVYEKQMSWLRLMPRVQPYYAIKANDDRAILDLLAHLGCRFDCASRGELAILMDELLVSADRLMHTHPCRDKRELTECSRRQVQLLTFDSELELLNVKEWHPSAQLLVRLKTSDEAASYRLSKKFGAPPQLARELLRQAVHLGLSVVGVSFHIGSYNEEPDFDQALGDARALFDYAMNDLNAQMFIVNIGGGFPGSPVSEYERLFAKINTLIDKHFPSDYAQQLNEKLNFGRKFKIIAEPGRYYCESAFTLCTRVIHKRRDNDYADADECQRSIDIENETSRSIMKLQGIQTTELIDRVTLYSYYVNAGFYNGAFIFKRPNEFPLIMKKSQAETQTEEQEETQAVAIASENLFRTRVWGPTCDSTDVLHGECYLPEIEVGDYLIYPNRGAYSNTCATPFNCFPLPKSIYVTFDKLSEYKQAFDNQKQKFRLLY